MKAIEIMTELIGADFLASNPGTVDTCKTGNPEKEIKKIGTTFMATNKVLDDAASWGCDLLITHEPTYYNHIDSLENADPFIEEKHKRVTDSGICIWRWHDSIHFRNEDGINAGFLKMLGWSGHMVSSMIYEFDKPQNVMQMTKDIENKLNIRHVRIVGKRDGKVRQVGLFLGQRTGTEEWAQYTFTDVECCISGELCEWHDCETTRDAAYLGKQKTILILGHCGSERPGMVVAADTVRDKFPDLEVKYFDCGELYSYAD